MLSINSNHSKNLSFKNSSIDYKTLENKACFTKATKSLLDPETRQYLEKISGNDELNIFGGYYYKNDRLRVGFNNKDFHKADQILLKPHECDPEGIRNAARLAKNRLDENTQDKNPEYSVENVNMNLGKLKEFYINSPQQSQ